MHPTGDNLLHMERMQSVLAPADQSSSSNLQLPSTRVLHFVSRRFGLISAPGRPPSRNPDSGDLRFQARRARGPVPRGA